MNDACIVSRRVTGSSGQFIGGIDDDDDAAAERRADRDETASSRAHRKVGSLLTFEQHATAARRLRYQTCSRGVHKSFNLRCSPSVLNKEYTVAMCLTICCDVVPAINDIQRKKSLLSACCLHNRKTVQNQMQRKVPLNLYSGDNKSTL